MAVELPEAAVWIKEDTAQKKIAETLGQGMSFSEKEVERIRGAPQMLGYGMHVIGPYFQRFRYPSVPIKGAILPASGDKPFFRNFNDEFLAVREPAYYFFAYTGKTSGEWVKGRRRMEPDNPSSNNKWNEIQGAQLFWTPQYGSLFTSMNWNADERAADRPERDSDESTEPARVACKAAQDHGRD